VPLLIVTLNLTSVLSHEQFRKWRRLGLKPWDRFPVPVMTSRGPAVECMSTTGAPGCRRAFRGR
jgi:hypothetical protein